MGRTVLSLVEGCRWAGRPYRPTRLDSLPTCDKSSLGLTTAKQLWQLLLWLAPLPTPDPGLCACSGRGSPALCSPPTRWQLCVGVSNPKRWMRPPGRSWGDSGGRSGPKGPPGLPRPPCLSGALQPGPRSERFDWAEYTGAAEEASRGTFAPGIWGRSCRNCRSSEPAGRASPREALQVG